LLRPSLCRARIRSEFRRAATSRRPRGAQESRMAMKRGEIWWADLAEPRGSEPGDRRPVLIVQDDLLTASALSTVMVVPLTTNLRRAEAIGNVRLPRRDSGLAKES